jgi:restriction system protein
MEHTGPIWIVRAGENAVYVDEFLRDGLVAIGWREVGLVDAGIPDEELDERFLAAYPDDKERSRRVGAAMVKRFAREVHPGHPIATSDRNRRVYPLGTVTGDIQWRDHGLPRYRKVSWTHEVDRDVLSVTARNSLGAIATMFRLGPEIAQEMWSKARPIGTVSSTPPALSQSASPAEETEEIVLLDVEAKAQQFVEDRLARLDWREMQELVAGVLRAMGYRTRVAADGADRGVDIFASPDGLGLQEPRIFVEVKHRRTEQMGAPQVRAFLGGRKPGDRCLFVSTGGFSREARYEADRSTVPITLLTLADLRDLLIEHYDQVDASTRGLVPLRQIYWPVD